MVFGFGLVICAHDAHMCFRTFTQQFLNVIVNAIFNPNSSPVHDTLSLSEPCLAKLIETCAKPCTENEVLLRICQYTWPNLKGYVDLVILTEETLNVKLHSFFWNLQLNILLNQTLILIKKEKQCVVDGIYQMRQW